LEKPNEPVNDMSYFECLDTVMEKSKSLGDGMTGIANNAKKSEHEPFGEAVKDVSNAITGLVEAAAQAAYLVGVSDPSSVAGRSGLVDQAAFARASQVPSSLVYFMVQLQFFLQFLIISGHSVSLSRTVKSQQHSAASFVRCYGYRQTHEFSVQRLQSGLVQDDESSG
jgi:talin